MFVDSIRVYARAGHGGKGCVAFLREAFRPKGGPSGGNGGRGGDVIIEASHDLNNLIAQFYQPRLIAKNGEPGSGRGMDGKAGKDLIVKVPCGTTIWRLPDPDEGAIDSGGAHPATEQNDIEMDVQPDNQDPGSTEHCPTNDKPAGTPLSEDGDRELVADMTTDGQPFVLCKGGRGGLGNRNFATARRQAPRFAQPGESGTEGHYQLELKIIAEVGIIGFPNAGKSTLLSAISHAKPKIAAYPFTTLHPQIGIVEYDDYKRLTVCDVPGLIEGAHQNVGLGHAFLRHIERCPVLVFLIDMAGSDGRKPWDDFQQLREELRMYDSTMCDRPFFVAANKMDEAVAQENLNEFMQKVSPTKVLPMAAAFDEGIDTFKTEIRRLFESAE